MARLSPSPDQPGGDVAACRALLRRHARSFHAASCLLPMAVRDPAAVLYAFCRIADDAVDDAHGTIDALAAVAALRDRLDRVYAGTPRNAPVDRAFADLVARCEMPRHPLEHLLEGLEWDARGHHYETLDDLLAYASRVAGSVGAMMAVLMGTRSRAGLARACDLGVAMQLSNVARDVHEDALLGRLYLPAAWLRASGCDPQAWLAHPVYSEALGRCVIRLVQEAEPLYARAAAGLAELPPGCRPAIRAASLLYAEIGHQVRLAPAQAFARRTTVARSRRAWLLASALVAPGARRSALEDDPLDCTRSLVEAVCREPVRQPSSIDFLVALFTRLERRNPHRPSLNRPVQEHAT